MTSNRQRIAEMILMGLCFTWGLLASAQAYSIEWYSLGGGGRSTGGIYAVSGTVGQPAAGMPMTGGSFGLQGGFWNVTIVQTAGAPRLFFMLAGPGQATIWWEQGETEWVLQESSRLVPDSWSSAPSGITNPVTRAIPMSAGIKFYRLHRP